MFSIIEVPCNSCWIVAGIGPMVPNGAMDPAKREVVPTKMSKVRDVFKARKERFVLSDDG